MKKLAFLTTAITALALSASILSALPVASLSLYAQAEDAAQSQEETAEEEVHASYPQSFISELSLNSPSDYAVNGTTYAFAQGTTLLILSEEDDKNLTTYDCGFEIKNVDYDGDNLYFGDAEGKAYLYPDNSAQVNYTFAENDIVQAGEYSYFIGNEKLWWKNKTKIGDFGEGFSLPKSYDGTAYAVKDNALYKISEDSISPLNLEYTDFSAADSIYFTNFKSLLKQNYTVTTATVSGGAYCTEVDLDSDGVYFKSVKTIKLSGVKSALLLATDGDASVILMNDGDSTKSYVTSAAYLTASAYKAAEKDLDGAYALTQTKLYSTPFMCSATECATIPQSAVLRVVEKFSLTFIDTEYYRVTYTDSKGKTVSGFIAAGFLSPYTFSAEQNKEETVSDEFDYSTNVERVILVLIIVGLVIVAIAYLTIIGTKTKQKTKKSDKIKVDIDDTAE